MVAMGQRLQMVKTLVLYFSRGASHAPQGVSERSVAATEGAGNLRGVRIADQVAGYGTAATWSRRSVLKTF
jgi:hypothetical protein